MTDLIQSWLQVDSRIELASRALSLHAFGDLAGNLARMAEAAYRPEGEHTALAT